MIAVDKRQGSLTRMVTALVQIKLFKEERINPGGHNRPRGNDIFLSPWVMLPLGLEAINPFVFQLDWVVIPSVCDI